MKNALWLIEFIIAVFISFPFAVLPHGLSLRVGTGLGLLLYYAWGSRRTVAEENLKRVFSAGLITPPPDTGSIIRDNFKNLGRAFMEVLKVYYGFDKKIIDSVQVSGLQNYAAALSKNKGIILITGHCGNWELLALALGLKTGPINVVARAQNNPYFNKLIEKVRLRYGNRVIYKKGALKRILTELRQNSRVGILMDQAVLPDEGYIIDFLGSRAWTTKMPALIARKTGAAVLPVFINRTEKGHEIKLCPEVRLSETENQEESLLEDTKKFSSYIENYIREHPSEWLWIHRRWKRT